MAGTRIISRTITFLFATVALSAPTFAQGFFSQLFDPGPDSVRATFGQEYLFATRDTRIDSGTTVVNGADAGRLGFDHSDFDYESGYRFTLGIENCEHRIEAVFANYGTWFAQDQVSMSAGLSFDNSAANWPGASTLGPTTFFTSMHVAATATLGGEGDEDEGLGPNTAFGDTAPLVQRNYQSELQDIQVNWMDNDPSADLRFGLGYRNLQLDEVANLQIAGTFRAADTGIANGGLSHATLTGIAGLTFSTNTANGIEDESAAGNNGTPDQLFMMYSGRTSNDLNGFQVIVNASMINTPRWEVALIGRAGAFHNHSTGIVSERYVAIGDDVSAYSRTYQDSKDSVAFVGGIGTEASWRISDRWRLFGTYSGTFISGVALGPEQAAGIRGGVYQVNADGNIIVHGGTTGLEFIY